jgi:hypothetical protein
MRRMLTTALTIVFVFTSNPSYGALAPGQKPSEPASDPKKQVALIPAGKVVEVKLQQKGSKKITGKLGPVTDEGFEVQTVKSGKISSEKVAFADVKSVKEKEQIGKADAVVATVLIVVLILGVAFAVAVRGAD